MAIIKVGAATEVELKEKKHRVEDALSATKAAVEEGIVAGGGTAFIRARSVLNNLNLTGDEAISDEPPLRPGRSEELPIRRDEPLVQPHKVVAARVTRLVVWTRDVPIH